MKSKTPVGRSELVGYLPLVVLPSFALASSGLVPPWSFMCALAFSIYFGLKWLTWWHWKSAGHSTWRSFAYVLAWPGMDAGAFLDESKRPARPETTQWLLALFKTALGAALIWQVSRHLPAKESLLRGWIGMAGLILLVHFGIFHIAALFWQSLGVEAQPIMRAPLNANSLSEFWGKRWNVAFHQLAYEMVFRPIQKYLPVNWAMAVVFLISGLIHDLVISVTARGGYFQPTAYFALQGCGLMMERSRFGKTISLDKGIRGRMFMLLVTAGPVSLLFHAPFVMRVIIPFMQAIHAL